MQAALFPLRLRVLHHRRPAHSLVTGGAALTIARYAARGWITPALRTPGGQYRWDVEKVKAEMEALWKRE